LLTIVEIPTVLAYHPFKSLEEGPNGPFSFVYKKITIPKIMILGIVISIQTRPA